jgi:hypothetical protein
MTLLDYFRKKPTVTPPVVVKPPPLFHGLGLFIRAQEYRQNDSLVGDAMAIIADDRFQRMLEVLRNEDPARFPLAFGTPLQDRAVHQATAEGYALAVEPCLPLAGNGRNRKFWKKISQSPSLKPLKHHEG